MWAILYPFLAGFAFWDMTTHPKRRVRKAMPSFRLGRLEILPCLRIHGTSRAIHIHHWIYLPLIVLVSIPLDNHILDSNLLRSFLMGGAVQGFLINKKSRRIVFPKPLEQSDEYR